MDREYDIFEKLSDGKLEWRCFVTGLKAARVRLKLLAARSKNEFFAIHTPTKEIAARVNDERATN
jgi:hypothetical protein